MAVSKTNLLILPQGRKGLRLQEMIQEVDSTYVVPLIWLITKRLQGSLLLDATLNLFDVEGVQIVGIASPRRLKPLSFYLPLVALGWITLSTPMIVRLCLSNSLALSLNEARACACDALDNSQFDSENAAKLRQRILRAKSIGSMARAVSEAIESQIHC